jgi:hypothetical protein
MFSSGDLFICLVVGLAVPLAILDVARSLLEGELPRQADGFHLERRVMPWVLALLAGPALLFDRVAEGWREKSYSNSDIAIGIFLTAGWASIYGFVLLKAAIVIGA